MVIVLGNLFAIPVLLFKIQWYISIPLICWIGHLSTSKVLTCPLTERENNLRSKIGAKHINGFIGNVKKKLFITLGKW